MRGFSLRQLLPLVLIGQSVAAGLAKSGPPTAIHEAGRCALRGQCGSKSFFGTELPCPDNEPAQDPEAKVREQIVSICGEAWNEGPVCCEDDQLEALSSNLKKAETFISSCPACKANFFNLFCTFTCSPDQSLFINVTNSQQSNKKKEIVTELDYLVTDGYGSDFFDSCKDVKFSGTNGYAMDFIGGGAKNFSAFLKFLGDEKLLGSPFQMNFPRPGEGFGEGMQAMDDDTKKCNGDDEKYRCTCIDCPSVCPELPEVSQGEWCHVGALPCLSFAAIFIYSIFFLVGLCGLAFHIFWMKHTQRKSERLRLLQDSVPSDDEDEGDVVHNAGLLERPERSYRLNTILDRAFNRLGRLCATYPAITIVSSIVVVGLLSIGWVNFAVERDPVRLWVSPTSAAAEEKAFFDENFGPFFRAEQAFLVNDSDANAPSPVLSYDTLTWWFDVESQVQRLKSKHQGVTLDDVCYKPTGNGCVVQSVTGYFEGDVSNLEPRSWEKDLKRCVESPLNCLPDFQQPLKAETLFGGWNEGEDVLGAVALIATWVVQNHDRGTEAEARAMDWEESMKELMLAVQDEARERGLRLSFSTEISLEQELNKSSNTDANIVVISYIIMFLYASLALGSTTLAGKTLLNNPRSALVQSKFTLGVIGILIVLLSVSASVGLFSGAGIKVTLIIAEVIPFLVLAVGVDNIFLIVHEFERVNISHPDDPIEDRIAKALGRMGPSILLSATTETIAFALGAVVGMPAVRNFAVYAAGAVLVNALLQVTMFVAVLAVNQARVEANRMDCFPCVKVRRSVTSNGGAAYRNLQVGGESGLQRFIRKTYAPALLNRKVKAGVLVAFLGLFAAGVSLIPEVALGLDQRIALPSDSYLIPYFNDLSLYFNAGPPVYFVTRELNVTERHHQQQLCGRFSTCETFSLANVLEQERKRPQVSYVADPAASWIDDFFLWLNPADEGCCVEDGQVCFEGRQPPWNISLYGMPEGNEFIHYIDKWITSPTNAECALGGKAPYSNAIVIDSEKKTIPASHFRSSHVPLRTQDDFIQAYASARRIADTISDRTGADVFPYSKFYVFFDQYASIVNLTGALLGSALAIIFILTSVLLGSIRTGLVVTVTVIMIVVDIIGTMAVVHVSLNALSLVNLVICVGIGVEFCAHIARAFMFPSRNVMDKAKSKFRGKDTRVWTALVNVGGSVFSGITVTKLLGVFVLAFTRSKVFEIYYFRIWLALVILAAIHALIFLPVALSIFGGEGYLDPESDGGLEEDLASRRYRVLLPEEEYDSDY